MDMATRLILYILIANVGYVIFSLAGKGFRAFGGYIMQLGVLMLFMVLALLKAESGFWAVIGGLVGVFVLVGIPLIIQKQIDAFAAGSRALRAQRPEDDLCQRRRGLGSGPHAGAAAGAFRRTGQAGRRNQPARHPYHA